METKYLVAFIIIFVLLLGTFTGIYFYKDYKKGTISVSGQATVSEYANELVIYVGLENYNESASIAQAQLDDKVTELTEFLTKMYFVPKKNIETTGYSLSKHPTGNYYAYTGLKITVIELILAGPILELIVNKSFYIQKINYELSEDKLSKLKEEAFKQAAENAMEKAEFVARGMGEKLGELVLLTDSTFDYKPQQIYGTVAAGSSVAEATSASAKPTEISTSANIKAVFKIA